MQSEPDSNPLKIGKLFEVSHFKNSHARTPALHHHDHYEMFVLLEGEVTYCIENKKITLQAGDVMLVSPQELHRLAKKSKQADYERIVVWISKQFMNKYSTGKTNLAHCFMKQKQNSIHGTDAQKKQVASIARALQKAMEQTDRFGYDMDSICCLIELLVHVNRLCIESEHVPVLSAEHSNIINDIVLYINAHFCEDLSLDGIAELFYISKYHLSHAFQNQIGTSVYRYIIQKRLQLAREMLLNMTPPSEVYSPCGFGDYANFYRSFKLEYHMSPKQYQKTCK